MKKFMKKHYRLYMIIALSYTQAITSKMETISYQDISPFSPDAPGYNVSPDDPKFNNIKPILFTPYEDTITGDDPNTRQVGYYWDAPDPHDHALQYTGKARIGNSRYINVVAVNANNISTVGDADSITSTGNYNIYQPPATEQKKFDSQYLVPIGTFMKKNDPTIYKLFGQYETTAFPDPIKTENL